jgi:hypothetical protein
MTRSRQTADWGSRAGLAKIVPSSVAVGAGTGSSDASGTVTFSGASSVSLNGCFTSSYTNYKIQFIWTAPTTTASITMRLRASGSDTSANYKNQNILAANTTIQTRQNDTGTDDWYLGIDVNSGTVGEFTIFRPQTATKTSFMGLGFSPYPATQYMMITGGEQTDSTQFDGFTVFAGTGMAGTVSVYGYN